MKCIRSCENCIWFGKCFQEGGCDNYDPISQEENEDALVGAFESDLRDRHEHYQELVKEQND